jgi:hypothetical protein
MLLHVFLLEDASHNCCDAREQFQVLQHFVRVKLPKFWLPYAAALEENL